MLNGSCNCGAVSFSVKAENRATACHCGQCRKQTGHFWASGRALHEDYTINGEVRWYASSDFARRGFAHNAGVSCSGKTSAKIT